MAVHRPYAISQVRSGGSVARFMNAIFDHLGREANTDSNILMAIGG